MVRSRTYIATPPGATIKEQLNDRDMSQKEFAVRMDMSEKHISKLVNGEVQLTPDVAVRLEMVLGVPAEFWSNLEAIYREKLIKANAENTMDKDIILARLLPYGEMVKYGWVPEVQKTEDKVMCLRRYFEVVELSLLESNRINKIACRRMAITEKGSFTLLAWAQEARREARKIAVKPIDLMKLTETIPIVRSMTILSPEKFCPELTRLFSECGIALIFLPHLKGSYLQGATFMDGKKIVMGITTRGKDADKFWFSLFHEIAHIMLGHINFPDGTSEEDEKSADYWARDVLIPPGEFENFKKQKTYSAETICEFAQQVGVAPGIVVGRLQNEGYIKYSMFNELKEHYEIMIQPDQAGA